MLDDLEDQGRVETYEKALQENLQGFLDHARQVEGKYGLAGEKRLGCQAWPLRPLFLSQERVRFVAQTLVKHLRASAEALRQASPNLPELAESLNLDEAFLRRLELALGLKSPELTTLARPDGFWLQGRFVVSEWNVGSGLLATLSYTAVLRELLTESPVWKSLGWEQKSLGNPFQVYVEHLLNKLGHPRRANMALFSLSEDAADIFPWEEELYCHLFEERRIRTTRVDETTVTTDAMGNLRLKSDGSRFDEVIGITNGEGLLKELRSSLTLGQEEIVRELPLAHPLACLAFSKGALPWLQTKALTRVESDRGTSVEYAPSHWPDASRADEYRVEKDKFVIKRSWTGKDTAVGCSSSPRAWNRAVARALESSDYLVQSYQALPKIMLPVLLENGSVEKIPVGFEMSPFLINGDYSGSLVRYAPDVEGIVLSPSPPGMGLTMVYES